MELDGQVTDWYGSIFGGDEDGHGDGGMFIEKICDGGTVGA